MLLKIIYYQTYGEYFDFGRSQFKFRILRNENAATKKSNKATKMAECVVWPLTSPLSDDIY